MANNRRSISVLEMEDPVMVLKVAGGSGTVGRNPQLLPTGSIGQFPQRVPPQKKVKQEPDEVVLPYWDTHFRQETGSPCSRWGSPQPPQEPTPWDDAKGFLASFEQVAKACRWPKYEWVSRLLPALGGQAERAFSSLEAGEQEDYGKLKMAILQGSALSREKQRQHFRRFCYQEAEGPRWACSRLQELCRQWLKVERHSKEQILELLILEQFLAILPGEIQSWVRARGPDTCSQAVALAEDFLQKQPGMEEWEQQDIMPCEEVAVGFSGSEQAFQPPDQSQLQGEAEGESDGGSCLPDYRPANDQEQRSYLQGGVEERDLCWIPQGRFTKNFSSVPDEQKLFQNQTRPKIQPGIHIQNKATLSIASVINRKILGKPLLFQIQKSSIPSGLDLSREPDDNIPVPERPYHKCPICGKTFGQSSHLNFHQRTHDVEKPYKCTQCGSSFHSRQGLIYHQRSHAGEKPYKCSFCGKNFSQSSHLLVHKRSHTGEKPFRCPTCGKCFSRNSLLTIHQRTHTGEKPYTCLQCGSQFHSGSGLINHKRIHAGVKPYQCVKCGRDFIRKAHLIRHQSIHSDEKVIKCSHCWLIFSQSSNLAECPRLHSGVRPYKCLECRKDFSQSTQLTSHQRTHTGERPYSCPSCGRTFNQSTSLIQHQRIHTGEKPYQCSECGKSFRHSTSLTSHQRIHTGEKPYKCSDCGKGFCNQSGLINHKTIHTGERPYKCLECGKSFSQSTHLTSHQRIHTGERPYKCSDCNKTFCDQSGLVKHQRIHTGQKPYKCLACGKSFSQSTNLIRHQRIHTGEEAHKLTSPCNAMVAFQFQMPAISKA
ncbi:zinc finger protein 502-like [Ahaetulla prasina]|uniref:zinc finger protein 502-like n=1 Tax=Ahaetulla prasina TaxID=499056 RepID=UPI0026481962|nr:zinc finger protein 502-like [Ahaetulla prasina]